MESRLLGRTGRSVGVVGLGCWQLGADWGSVSEDAALGVLTAAVDAGVTFLDTADVYGDGRSEKLIGTFLASRPRARPDRRDEDGPPRRPAHGRRLHALVVPRLDRPVAREPAASTPSTWCSCTARRRRCTAASPRTTRWTCSSTRAASRRYGVSVETVTRRSTRSSGRTSPPCRSSSTCSAASRWRRCCPPPLQHGRRHHRARAAGVGPAVGQVRRAHAVRRRRPPLLQPRRRGVRRGGDVRRGAVRGGRRRRARGRRADARRRTRPRSWPCGGSSTSPACPSSSPARARPSRPSANAAAASLPPIDEETLDGLRGVYDGRIRPHVHGRW